MKPIQGDRGEVHSAKNGKVFRFLFRKIALSAILLFPVTQILAQSEQTPVLTPELKIGDKLPDEVWNLPLQIVNHPEGKETVTLKDYRGKLIILEFWATWCGPCITMMPHLLDMKANLGDEVIILPVTYEERQPVLSFLENPVSESVKELIKRSFSSIVEGSILSKLFHPGSLPHTVILDRSGIVTAATHPKYLSESILLELLSGEQPYIPHKVNKVKELPPLLTLSLNSIKEYKFPYYSTVMGELDGLAGQTTTYQVDSANNRVRYLARNTPILHMYFFTGWYMAGVPSRRILEVRDPSVYDYYYDEANEQSTLYDLEWTRRNRYSYEAVLPLSMDKKSVFHRMRRDLDDFFDIKARMEKREIECWVLKRVEDQAQSFISEGGPSLSLVNGVQYRRSEGDTLLGPSKSGALTYVRNMKMNLFVINCLQEMDRFYKMSGRFAVPPVLDETNYTGKVDIDLPDKFTNLEDLRKVLQPQGLDLVAEVREIEMFVLTESGFDSFGNKKMHLTKFGYIPARNP